MIKNIVIPAAGNVVVVREFVEEVIAKIQEVEARTDGREKGLLRGDDQGVARRVNPWALVVGVGDPRQTQYGTTITTNVKPGDKVLIAQVGRDIELRTPEGEREFLYVLPFEGITATMKYECSICKIICGEEPEGRRCPAGCKDVVRPTAVETSTIARTH